MATRLAAYGDPTVAISRASFSIASVLGADGICTMIATVAARLRSTALVAVTFTDLAVVTFGAVKSPLGEIVPVLALQITAVLTVLAKLSANRSIMVFVAEMLVSSSPCQGSSCPR